MKPAQDDSAHPEALDDRRKQHPYDQLAPHWRFVWRCAVGVAVGLFLAWMSDKLLPAGEAAKRLLAQSYLPWLTAMDQMPLPGLLQVPDAVLKHTSYAQVRDNPQQVVVVTIDDADLKLIDEKWPLNLVYYASLVDQLQREGARGIFIDLLLIDPRPWDQVKALREAACTATLGNVPVWLASLPGVALSGSPEELLLPCVRLASPLTSEDKFDRSTWEYPLCSQGRPSPALALACPGGAQALSGKQCKWQSQVDSCPTGAPSALDEGYALHLPARSGEAPPDADASPKMALVWPAKGSERNSKLLLEVVPTEDNGSGIPDEPPRYEPACNASLPPERYILPISMLLPQDGPPDWLKAMVPAALNEMLRRRSKPLCPFVPVLPMRALMGHGQVSSEQRQALIRGNLVMIGANFVGQSDRHAAPLRHDISGVHVHAMALDNLLTYGEKWRRVDDFDIWDWHADGTVYALLAVMLTVFGWEVQQLIGAMAAKRESPTQTPLTDGLFAKPPWMPRWLAALKNLYLMAVTLGRLPTRRRGQLALPVVLGYAALTVLWWTLLIGVLFYIANDRFHIGPLSQVEYVLAPLALGFIDQGHRLARGAALLWASTAEPNPAQHVRDLRHVTKDEDGLRQYRESQLNPTAADAAAGPPGPAPAPHRTPP